MSKRIVRRYTYPDVVMVTASAVIIQNAIDHQPEFLKANTKYTPVMLSDLAQRIASATSTHLGMTPGAARSAASSQLKGVMELALENAALIKTSIETNIDISAANKAVYLTNLGFKAHYTKFAAGDQESGIELGVKFALALPGIQPALVAAGVNPTTLTDTLNALAAIKDSNLSQEGAKGSGKQITDAAITEFNEVYNIVIAVCKVGQQLFRKNPVIAEKFVFSRIANAL